MMGSESVGVDEKLGLRVQLRLDVFGLCFARFHLDGYWLGGCRDLIGEIDSLVATQPCGRLHLQH